MHPFRILPVLLALAACPQDAGPIVDTGASPDATQHDAGRLLDVGSAADATLEDGGLRDAGLADTGVVDAGVVDAGIDPESPEGRGLALYTEYCGFCHGDDGEGYVADNANALSNPQFLASASDFFLWASIMDGRPGTSMSPWGTNHSGPLTDSDAWDLISYIRLWQELPSIDVDSMEVDGDAEAGLTLYLNMNCAACHGLEGGGVTAMTLNNPVFHHFATDGFIYHAIAKGRSPTAMPAYEDELSEQDIANLVAYIRTWAEPIVEPEPDPFVPGPLIWENHLINPDGPAADFQPRVVEREGAEFNDEFVPAAQVLAAMNAGQSFTLVDARAASDYLLGHINGATCVPFDLVDQATPVITRDRWVITYCGCPHAVSGRARTAFKRAGFERVAVLDEGYYFWTDEGYPICRGREQYCDQ